jgi:hypothetical protein
MRRLILGLALAVAGCGPDRAQVAADAAASDAAYRAALAAREAALAAPAMGVPEGAVADPVLAPGERPPGWTGDGSTASRLSATCANGETIELRFFPDVGVAVLIRRGVNTELQFEPGPSGLRYTAPDTVVTGSGRSYTVAEAGEAEVTCTAAG